MYKEVFLTHFNLSFFKRKKNTCAQYTGYENSCVSKDEKRLIFREADMMREMSMEDLLSYDVSEIDLFYEDGQAVKLPPKGMETDFINERWAICRARNDHGNKILMDNIEECYYEDDDESDDENKDEDRSEKSMSKKSKDTILYEWRKHRYNISITRTIKKDSQQRARDSDSVASYCCFDLQQVLDTPHSNVGEMFYKRTLSCYNFVVNDDGNASCYVWPETEGNRGVNEAGTCLIDFVLQKAKLGVKNILSFCDNCPGQNRNRPIAAAMVYTVMNTPIEVFFMCFLEKGHTENSADDIHSLIERENNVSVYSPRDWVVLMRQIKTKMSP